MIEVNAAKSLPHMHGFALWEQGVIQIFEGSAVGWYSGSALDEERMGPEYDDALASIRVIDNAYAPWCFAQNARAIEARDFFIRTMAGRYRFASCQDLPMRLPSGTAQVALLLLDEKKPITLLDKDGSGLFDWLREQSCDVRRSCLDHDPPQTGDAALIMADDLLMGDDLRIDAVAKAVGTSGIVFLDAPAVLFPHMHAHLRDLGISVAWTERSIGYEMLPGGWIMERPRGLIAFAGGSALTQGIASRLPAYVWWMIDDLHDDEIRDGSIVRVLSLIRAQMPGSGEHAIVHAHEERWVATWIDAHGHTVSLVVEEQEKHAFVSIVPYSPKLERAALTAVLLVLGGEHTRIRPTVVPPRDLLELHHA